MVNKQNFSGEPEDLKISIGELQKKYGIGYQSLRARMDYLGITTWKVSGRAYLDVEQVAHMDGLHEHIKMNRCKKGYPIPAPTKPTAKKPVQTTPTFTITVQPTQEVGFDTHNEPVQSSRSQSLQQADDESTIVISAQGKATDVPITVNVIAQQYLENSELLADDLKQKICKSAEVPVINPFAYAASLVNLA